MDDSRTTNLISLFERALTLPLAQRDDLLKRETGDDVELYREVSTLLDAHESSADFFDSLKERLVSPAYAAVVGVARRARDAVVASQLQTALGNSYKILNDLGGGMSRVFLAEEVKLGRKIVIKVLPPEMGADGSVERFRREIQLAAQLQHPHIVPLLTSDSAGSFLYYTMPFVTGESLRARLARDGALPVREARKIWHDVLDALAHAHTSGVIHCDIKPGNVLLSARTALVSDFGIARAVEAAGGGESTETAPAITTGTPMYMAPEQVKGDRTANHRVDIYAAGLVMYEMLEGRLPFSGGTPRDLVLARLTREPSPITRADCPPELAKLVMSCLAQSPDDRPQTADAILERLDAIATTAERASPTRRVASYGLAVAVLVVISLGAKQLADNRVKGADSPPSIAVLPFTNLDADSTKAAQDSEVTARWQDVGVLGGMAEDMIMLLSRFDGVRVVPSVSVAELRKRRLNLRQIAESLGVSHVLLGRMHKAGSRLRVEVRLVDPRTNATRWSKTYDREMNAFFAMQDEIVRTVAREVGARTETRGAKSSARRYTPSVEAYEWYLRGLDFTMRGTASNTKQAREYFTRAIALDSNFAAGYAGLAMSYLGDDGEKPGDYREKRALGEAAALKAVALDDSLAEGHAALGWTRSAQGDRVAAEAELNRAIALDPRVPRGFEGLARIYQYTGTPAKQLAAARAGLEFARYSHSAIREWALALMANGRYDEAIAVLKPLKLLNPAPGVAGALLGQCYVAKKMWPEAIAEQRWAMGTTTSRISLAFLGHALARAGQRDEANKILADLLSGRADSHGAFGIASVYAGLRDFENAFKWLEKSVEDRSVRVYVMGPVFEEMRADPRFARIRARLRF